VSKPKQHTARVRTAADKKKALGIYDQMRREGKVARSLVVVERHNGHLDLLGQGLRLNEMADLIMASAQAVASAAEQQNAPRREAAAEPAEHGPVVGLTTPEHQRGMTTDAEGLLVPPAGETLISCSLCSHPRFHVTIVEADQLPGRVACAHCGNEIIFHRMHHPEGRA
jgi:hypothetical protein